MPLSPHERRARQRLRRRIRLSERHERGVLLVAGFVFVTGAAWLVLHFLVARPDEFGTVHHPLEPWTMRLHGAAAMAALVVLGTLALDHIRVAWQARRNRASGAVMLAAAAVLVASGYGLYYVGSDTLRPWISLVHWSIGLAALPVLVLHRVLGRRRGRRAGSGAAGTA